MGQQGAPRVCPRPLKTLGSPPPLGPPPAAGDNPLLGPTALGSSLGTGSQPPVNQAGGRTPAPPPTPLPPPLPPVGRSPTVARVLVGSAGLRRQICECRAGICSSRLSCSAQKPAVVRRGLHQG